MRIGIVGGGLLGTALAYFLSETTSHHVTLLEQSASLGGLNDAVELDDGLSISRYHHVLLPEDHAVRDLCARLGLADELVFHPARTGFIHNGAFHSLNTLWDFLSFPPLSARDRLRLANTIFQARRIRDWRALDTIPVRDWLVQTGSQQTFTRIWAPLLEAKFDNQYDRIPATYIWSWINRMMAARHAPHMKTSIGYLRGSHRALVEAMADKIRARGGAIVTSSRVREIEIRGGQLGQVRTHNDLLHFDQVVAAVPTPTFARLIPGADQAYLNQLDQSRYLGLVCPALVVDRPLSGYWTLNLTDPSSPFSSVIEMPHPQDPRYYVVYLPKYTAPENDWMGVPDHDIQEAWLIRLRQLFPSLRHEHIRHFIVNRSRYADPVHTLQPLERLLPLQTPYAGLLLANVSQVYPGLPTSENAILHAREVAHKIAAQPVLQAEPAA